MTKIGTWLSSTDTPRWLVAAAFVSSTLLSITIGNFTEDKKRVDDNRSQQIRSLQDSMVQFQVFASAISTEMNETKAVSQDSKNNLIKNLNEQWAKTKIVQLVIPQADFRALEEYRSAITYMIDCTRRIGKLTEMGEFWTAASRIIIARNKLNQELKDFI